MKRKTLWTLVQHSGFGYGEKPGFEHAVEERHFSTKKDEDRIRKAGGVIFTSYMAASDAAELVNYPDEGIGLYPRARGTFARTKLDGLRVYVPEAKEERRAA